LLNPNQVIRALLSKYGFPLDEQPGDFARSGRGRFQKPLSDLHQLERPGAGRLVGKRREPWAARLRPFPQYKRDRHLRRLVAITAATSSYHAGHDTPGKTRHGGLTIQTSYVFSKIITDSDSYWGSGQAMGSLQPRSREVDRSSLT
jgi:hypothetical protein